MTTLAFPGQVPFTDPSVPAGGCELGLGRCVRPAELEVTIPATNDVRQLCREHAGWYMLGATTEQRRTVVRVRRLAESTTSQVFGTAPVR